MNVIDATLQNPLIGIVDEDASIRTSTRRLVNALGYRTETFSSAHEFLAANRVTDFACLILDRQMSGIGGLEVQRRLSVHERAPRIIFTGARECDDEKAAATKAGTVDFLHKPVSGQALFVAITKALQRHSGFVSPPQSLAARR